MKIDSLQQSAKGHAAADSVPRIIKVCIILLFDLGTKLDKAYNAHSVSQHRNRTKGSNRSQESGVAAFS